MVLGEESLGVGDRHLEAGEGDHFGARSEVLGVEGRALEGGGVGHLCNLAPFAPLWQDRRRGGVGGRGTIGRAADAREA